MKTTARIVRVALVAVAVFGAIALLATFTPHSRFIAVPDSGISAAPSAGGASWGDYDDDGWLDLLAHTPRGYRLYHNDAGLGFTDMSDASGITPRGESQNSATFGDYNGDRCLDIYIASGFVERGADESDRLYQNDCHGHFTDVSAAMGITDTANSKGVAWFDFDNDGRLDIVVPTYGDLTFAKTASTWTLTDWTFEPNMLYRNTGSRFENVAERAGVGGPAACPMYIPDRLAPSASGTMPEPIQAAPFDGLKANWQAVAFDYDNDGHMDFYVTNEVTINALYRNRGNGTFEDVTSPAGLCQKQSTHGVALGDYDNDGYMDIFAAGSMRSLLWHNNGNGTFSEVSENAGVANFGSLGWGAGFLDMDNDGDLDLYVINGASHNASTSGLYPSVRDRLYENDGGHFTEVTDTLGTKAAFSKSSGAFADYDNDGYTDVFIVGDTDFGDGARDVLYRNAGGSNHYLTVRLEGVASNSFGIGARLELTVGTKTQYRQVLSSGSFLSQNSMWPSFGLGKSKAVDSLVIHWPSGAVQTLANIQADQTLTVREPEM